MAYLALMATVAKWSRTVAVLTPFFGRFGFRFALDLAFGLDLDVT